MRKLPYLMVLPCVVAAILLAGSLSMAQPAQEQPNKYELSLTTQSMALPFKMPALPAGIKIPGMGDMLKPAHRIAGEAIYPNAAVEPIFVTVPRDLKMAGNKLDLHVPKPPKVEQPTAPEEKPAEIKKFEMTTKLYWHQEVARGPIVTTINTEDIKLPQMSRGDQRQMSAMMAQAMAKMQVDWQKQARGQEQLIIETVAGRGDYQLNTGAISMPLDGFLPAIQVTEPEELSSVDPAAGITLKWKPVEGARGFIVRATEMVRGEGSMTMTTWVSTVNEPPERVRNGGYEQATTIADDLAAEILLPPTATGCIMPPGMFKGGDIFMLTVTAVGNDYYSFDKDKGLTVRGKIRAEWTGMKMKGMPGGFPGMGSMPTGAGGGAGGAAAGEGESGEGSE